MTPSEVVGRWYDAHRRGDMDAARAVLAEDAVFLLPDRELRGFDAFLAFSGERRASRPAFSMAVADTMAGEQHVAVLLDLTEGDRTWQQVAVYAVREDRIASVWTSERGGPSA